MYIITPILFSTRERTVKCVAFYLKTDPVKRKSISLGFIYFIVVFFLFLSGKKKVSLFIFFFFLKKNPVGPVEYPQHFYFSHSLIFHSIRRPHTYTRICAGWGNGRVPFRPLLWQKYVGQRRMGRESLRTAEKETDSFWVLESKLEKI